MNVTVIVPTLNAGPAWQDWIEALLGQTCKIDTILVIDSGSGDGTQSLAVKSGFRLMVIDKSQYDHGATRQLALNNVDNADIVIYMTQDAVLADPDALQYLVDAFLDKSVGAAYGRQLPAINATAIEAHARYFNYPDASEVRSIADRDKYGFKLIFLSNSFAAYRVTALKQVGGFPAGVILGEDTYVCAKLLENDWKIAYQAKAKVHHSHNYSMLQEFNRYFDIGVFHARDIWLIKKFGTPGNEGYKFVCSELHYLVNHSPLSIPLSLCRGLVKYTAYRLGRMEKKLPLNVKKIMGMNKGYWLSQQ